MTLGIGVLTLFWANTSTVVWGENKLPAEQKGDPLYSPAENQSNWAAAGYGSLDLSSLEGFAAAQEGHLPLAVIARPLAPSAGSVIAAAQNAASGLDDDATSVELQTITVQAERPDWERILSPGAVDVIVPDDFKGEQKKLPEYLDMVPGLHVERRGGEGQYSTVTMRGSTSAQVNIYIDGVPQNVGGEGAVDLSLIPMSNVARIEVYRGYTPARFAGAPIGGVINIVTKRPEGFGGSASVGVKSFGGRSADATVTGPLLGGSLLMGVHRDQSHGDFRYKYMNTSDDPACGAPEAPCTRWRKSNQYQNTDALLKWQDENWYAKAAWKRTSRFHPNEITKKTNNDSQIDVRFGQQETWHRYQKVDQYDLMLGRRQTWGNLDFGLEVNYMKQEKEYYLMDFLWHPERFNTTFLNRAGQVWNTYDTERYGYSLDGSYKLGDRHLLEFRADLYDEQLVMDGNRRNSLTAGGGYGSFSDPRVLTFKRENRHAQISDTITLNDDQDLWLTIIARYDKARDKTDLENYWFDENSNSNGYKTWGVAMKKEIGDTWTIRGTGGSFVRYPTFYELYGDGVYVVPGFANQDANIPERETGHQWDFGVDWRGDLLGARSTLSATYFGRRTSNQIYPRYEPLYGTIHYVNGGVSEAWGLEMEAGFRWEKFDLDASATWQRTQLLQKTTFGLRVDEGEELPFMPTWEAHVRGGYRMLDDDLSLFVEHHYTGRMLENWTTQSTNSPYWRRKALNVTGVGARYRTPWGFALSAGVDDVFNQRSKQQFEYVGSGTSLAGLSLGARYPEPGRTFYLTLDYVFGGGSDSDSGGSAAAVSTASSGPAPTVENDLAAMSAGGQSSGKSPFYVSPRLIYTRQKVELADRDWHLGPGSGFHPLQNRPNIDPKYAGALPTIPGGSRSDSYINGGLALGVDLARVNGWPIRVEVEASTHYDGKYRAPGLAGEPRPSLAIGSPWYQRLQEMWNSGRAGADGVFYIVDTGKNYTKIDYRAHNAFLNVYYDFHNRTRFTPFLGAGAGVSFVKARVMTRVERVDVATINGTNKYYLNIGGGEVIEEVERDINFSWNAAVGLSYRLAENIDLDLSYRYVNNGYNNSSPGVPAEIVRRGAGQRYAATVAYDGVDIDLREAHQVVTGLRFSF